MVDFGPISLIAVRFPDVTKLRGELIKELLHLSKARTIRVVGFMAIAKDHTGIVTAEQLTDLSDEERIKLAAGIRALIGFGEAGKEGAQKGWETGAKQAAGKEFGLTKEQIREIADNMPKGTATGIVLIEHLWAKKLKETAMEQDGVVIVNAFITPQTLIAIGADIAEGAKIAEQVQYQ